jgi:hypothetical protein
VTPVPGLRAAHRGAGRPGPGNRPQPGDRAIDHGGRLVPVSSRSESVSGTL